MYLLDFQNHTSLELPQDALLTHYKQHTAWVKTGSPEARIIEWVLAWLPKDSVCLDIGAHCGTWSVALGKHGATVHAFEPTYRTYLNLCANVSLADLHAKVHVFNQVLSNTSGKTIQFKQRGGDLTGCSVEYYPLHDNTDPTVSFVTKTTATIDDCEWERLDFIKLDVEGHELQVLQGGVKTIKRMKPVIIFESWVAAREKQGVPSVQLRTDLMNYISNVLDYTIRPIRGNNEMFIADPRGQKKPK